MQKCEPVLIADSAKPTEAVIACVSESWVKLGGLVAYVDAALEQDVLHVPQRQRKSIYIITTDRITSGEELK